MTEYGKLVLDIEGKDWMRLAPRRREWLHAAIKTYPGDIWDGGREWRRRLVREMDHGNPLLIIILVPIAQLLIKYLIEWLLERRENRDLMMQWHYAAKSE